MQLYPTQCIYCELQLAYAAVSKAVFDARDNTGVATVCKAVFVVAARIGYICLV